MSETHGEPGSQPRPYGGVFWLCYLANTSLMIAFSCLFRYADFVSSVGGNEADLGLIVGVGMIGALCMRVVQAVGIDRYGARRVWLLSLAGFVTSCVGHLWVATADGVLVYALRVLMATSIAGAFGSSLTYISLRVPVQRVAEMIGMLGTSGFLGLAIGPAVGDMLFAGNEVTRGDAQRMFLVSAAAGSLSLVLATLATWNAAVPSARRRPPLWALIRRYHPGFLLVVTAAGGLGICLPHEFLRAYAAELRIEQIKVFFGVYALTAFVVRIATRRIVETWGTRWVMMLGMSALATSMLSYLLVSQAWQLAFPALGAGVAHAVLFPALVGGGSVSFPVRYRGLGTTLMLAMFDLGNLLGKPAIGGIIAGCHALSWPAYPVMFVSVAALLLSVALAALWLIPRELPAASSKLASPPAQGDGHPCEAEPIGAA